MKVTYQGFQATDLSPAPGATVGSTEQAATAARGAAARPPRGAARRVGVVFVHGIGVQKPAETFLDWSSAIVRILSDWRVEQHFSVDPVVRSQFAFDGGALPFLEVEIPAFGGREATTWILTEALWAQAIRPPSLDTAAAYLRDRLALIVAGIRSGFKVPAREQTWSERVRQLSARDSSLPESRGRAALLAELDRRRWAWIGALDWLQRTVLTAVFVAPVVFIGTLFLLLWAPLRRLPIGPLRDFADAKIIDSFITDWFGDLPTLLDDPVQAANVRARTAESIRAVHQQGCDSVVLIAHSGGAIVAFETLLDPAYLPGRSRAIEVDKLITLGEGLNLGWRLATAKGDLVEGHRLRGDLGKARKGLRWVDMWASFDPAPPGRLKPPTGVELTVGDIGEPGTTANENSGQLVVENRPITNFMSPTGDHGGYWSNDEGFLVPLLRHIDDPRGQGNESRFYDDRDLRTLRIERRRQRVAVLGAWRWIVAVGAIAGLALGGLGAGAPRLAGETLIEIWSRVPGATLISGPIDALWGALGTLLSLLPLGGLAADLPRIGPVLLGGFVIAALYLGLGWTGLWGWARWDERERAGARLERLPELDRQFAIGAFTTLAVSVIALGVAAASAGNQGRVFTMLLGGIALGVLASTIVLAVTRLVTPQPERPAGIADRAPIAPSLEAMADTPSGAPTQRAKAVKPQRARDTPRTPRAAPRTSRRGSRRPPHNGESEA